MQLKLGDSQQVFDAAFQALSENSIVERIFEKDHTVWRPQADEISNRLGWLDVAARYAKSLSELKSFSASISADGFTHVLLLGMGGSSLAPEVLSNIFGEKSVGLELVILDTTDPVAVKTMADRLPLSRTLFIVATKSGGTVETLSFFKYFYNLVLGVNTEAPGSQFVAITDPGSRLVELANDYGFRHTFVNDPNIGGRYSALSLFGLVPAALLGIDLDRFVATAVKAGTQNRVSSSDAARLGAAMGALALEGKDKLTLLLSDSLKSFGDWAEQLIAESTGKEGKGILPVVGETSEAGELFSEDRFFVGLSLGQDVVLEKKLSEFQNAGHPTAWINIADPYELAAQFLFWELATAIAGHVMDIQPFDQPDVESAKALAREMVAAYYEVGALPEGEAHQPSAELLSAFLTDTSAGDYIAVHAYIPPTKDADSALTALQSAIRMYTSNAVTVGYGPRFLHSTGQLHKGDRGNGRFIQFVSRSGMDQPIPDTAGEPASKMTFQVLKESQAMGDAQALKEADPARQVIRFDTGMDAAGVINELALLLRK